MLSSIFKALSESISKSNFAAAGQTVFNLNDFYTEQKVSLKFMFVIGEKFKLQYRVFCIFVGFLETFHVCSSHSNGIWNEVRWAIHHRELWKQFFFLGRAPWKLLLHNFFKSLFNPSPRKYCAYFAEFKVKREVQCNIDSAWFICTRNRPSPPLIWYPSNIARDKQQQIVPKSYKPSFEKKTFPIRESETS